ncbi:hypothetical protein V8D89_012309 [Ganoderma adspersum]
MSVCHLRSPRYTLLLYRYLSGLFYLRQHTPKLHMEYEKSPCGLNRTFSFLSCFYINHLDYNSPFADAGDLTLTQRLLSRHPFIIRQPNH